MTLLTMTPAIVAALNLYTAHAPSPTPTPSEDEPDLSSPQPGDPISHTQLVALSRFLKSHPSLAESEKLPIHLSFLLRGCDIYTPPPPPKPEKSPEYKALMARLRAEEEARSYERMLSPPATMQTFQQRFPVASHAHLFPSASPLAAGRDEGDDEMTYADVNRQLTLILNVLVSIVACSVCVWKAAWHWDVPARLALSMTSSIVVAVAEVAIYAGYLERLGEAKLKAGKEVEKKTIEESWVIEARKDEKSNGLTRRGKKTGG